MSIAVNYDDVSNQLRAAGLIIDKPLYFDTRIQRWQVENEDKEQRGWTRLKEWTSKLGNTYIVGSYGIWRGNDDGYTKIEMPAKDAQAVQLSKEDMAQIREAQKEAQRKVAEERKREAKVAATWAASVWAKCTHCEQHEYLTRKGIQPHDTRVLDDLSGLVLSGLDDANHYRLTKAKGALVVPMHDEHGNVCGIQFVYPKGHERAKKIERDKEFWPSGMAMGGSYGVIGPMRRTGVMLITEGFATGASLYESSGQTVAYAFSANNLAKVGKILRKKNPKLRLLFCADDDYLTDKNSGVTAAVAATAEIELSAWIKPDFLDETGTDIRQGKKFTDFNDLAILRGSALILADQINAKLEELNWRDALPVLAVRDIEGTGADERPAAVSVMALDEAVLRFVPLDDGTGKYIFDQWTKKIVLRDQMIVLLPAGVRGDDVKRNPIWISRGAYYLDEVGFDPSGSDKTVRLNTWRGWEIKPKKGQCEYILKTLEHLCSNEPNQRELFLWVLKWMAYPLQYPGAKMGSALIFHGPQGTGKSLIFRILASIYGSYATVIGNRAIEDKFNADWADSKLYILAEEVATSQDKWNIKNELKELVTGETVRVNPKNVAAYSQKNQMNIVYLSNEDMPIPLENGDRRHLVLYTPPCLAPEHYEQALEERNNGGIEAFYYFLMNIPLDGFGVHSRPPMTNAKQKLIELSSSSDHRFIHDWINGETDLPFVPCASMDLYKAYTDFCKRNGERMPRTCNAFLGYVGHIDGWENKKVRIYSNAHCEGLLDKTARMVIPESGLLQKAGNDQPPDKTQAEWLTISLYKFKNAEAFDDN